jgi:UDP-4-amino-4-deoxy-L-arabinose formyltransferase/UDP-glucuronic acid dehydrogenase (UDP-4-keto-hexauronic acid decarboxylating)
VKVAIIGRTEVLYDTALRLREAGHDIVCILTAKEAPEYARTDADFRELAASWGIPFAQGAKIIDHADFLASARADIAVSINFTGVVPQSVIDLFPFGVLNAHGGDLPRYRGNACQAWAILNGEERIGLCIHRMIGGELDSGDIITRDYLPIDMRTKITAVWKWIAKQTPALMLEAVSRLSADPSYVLEVQSQDPSKALRCYPRRPEDGLIDWNAPAAGVLRLVNASNRPYPGAFTFLDGEKVIVWDAELVDDGELSLAVPGQVTKITERFVEVACRTGKIRLLEVEVNKAVCSPASRITSIRKRLG